MERIVLTTKKHFFSFFFFLLRKHSILLLHWLSCSLTFIKIDEGMKLRVFSQRNMSLSLYTVLNWHSYSACQFIRNGKEFGKETDKNHVLTMPLPFAFPNQTRETLQKPGMSLISFKCVCVCIHICMHICMYNFA